MLTFGSCLFFDEMHCDIDEAAPCGQAHQDRKRKCNDARFDFNTKNNATHYQTSDQFHLDGTLADHIAPVWLQGGVVGAGVSGFFISRLLEIAAAERSLAVSRL